MGTRARVLVSLIVLWIGSKKNKHSGEHCTHCRYFKTLVGRAGLWLVRRSQKKSFSHADQLLFTKPVSQWLSSPNPNAKTTYKNSWKNQHVSLKGSPSYAFSYIHTWCIFEIPIVHHRLYINLIFFQSVKKFNLNNITHSSNHYPHVKSFPTRQIFSHTSRCHQSIPHVALDGVPTKGSTLIPGVGKSAASESVNALSTIFAPIVVMENARKFTSWCPAIARSV